MKARARYVINKDKESILAGAANSLAMKLAKQANDPLYDEYQKCKEKLEQLRMKIRQKYGRKALTVIKKNATT